MGGKGGGVKNRYKKGTNEYYAGTPIILIIPFTRRLPYYILLIDLGQEPATTHQQHHKNRGGGGFLLVIPKEMILVLTNLNRTSTILRHSFVISKNKQQSTTTIPHKKSHLGDQNAVAGLHRDLQPLAFFIESTWAHGQDLGLGQLLDGRLGEEDS